MASATTLENEQTATIKGSDDNKRRNIGIGIAAVVLGFLLLALWPTSQGSHVVVKGDTLIEILGGDHKAAMEFARASGDRITATHMKTGARFDISPDLGLALEPFTAEFKVDVPLQPGQVVDLDNQTITNPGQLPINR